RTRLAGDTVPTVGGSTDRQRANPPWIATRFHSIGEEEQQAERTLQVLEHMRQRIVLLDMRRLGQQMYDDLGGGRALENVPMLLILAPQQGRVDQISVMRDGNRAHEILPQQRLGVTELA